MQKKDFAAMNHAYGRINGLYQRWYTDIGLNSFHIDTLNAMYNEPDLSQKEISSNYMIPIQTVNNIVKAMEKQNYLELVPDPKDKRRKKITYTEAGNKYLEETVQPVNEMEASIYKKMGKKDYRELIRLMELYGDILEEQVRKQERGQNDAKR